LLRRMMGFNRNGGLTPYNYKYLQFVLTRSTREQQVLVPNKKSTLQPQGGFSLLRRFLYEHPFLCKGKVDGVLQISKICTISKRILVFRDFYT
jgi:hypothetical protein